MCGSTLSNSATLQTSGKCNKVCPGDNSTLCGGPYSLQLYVSTKFNAAGLSDDLTRTSLTLPRGWQPAQDDNTTIATDATCIREVSGRALTGASTSSPSMTIETCLSYCGARGFQLAGVQYSRECYCGNDLRNGAALSSKSSGCGMPCAGNPTQTCGGESTHLTRQN